MSDIIYERFNDSTITLWVKSGGVSAASFDGSSKALITSTANSSEFMERSFPAQTGKLVLAFDIFLPTGMTATAKIIDNVGATMATVTMSSTVTFTTNAVGTPPAGLSLTASSYQQVILALNSATSTAHMYFTHPDHANGSWYFGGSLPYILGAATKMRVDCATTGSLRLDEICVFSPTRFLTGDSISDGKPRWSSHPGYTGRTDLATIEKHYPAALLRGHYGEFVADLGFGGSNSTSVLYIAPMFTNIGFTSAVIHVGHNDFYAGTTTLATYKTNMLALVDSLIAGGITDITICGIPPSNLFDNTPAGDEADRVQANAYLFRLAMNRACKFANNTEYMTDKTLAASGLQRPYASFVQPDGVHYNENGTFRMVEAIVDASIPSIKLTATPNLEPGGRKAIPGQDRAGDNGVPNEVVDVL